MVIVWVKGQGIATKFLNSLYITSGILWIWSAGAFFKWSEKDPEPKAYAAKMTWYFKIIVTYKQIGYNV